jgi:CubicO group peptidase (beta-lactamase class C family)
MALLWSGAHDAATGWAVRTESGWDTETSFAGPSTVEPIFDLASLTKPMTAVAIACAGIDRKTRLADLVEEATGTASADATLELLLSHRAGLESHQVLGNLRVIADARRADAAGAFPVTGFAPIYSDLGYILAGVALARACGAGDAGEAIERFVHFRELGTARTLTAQNIDFARRVRKTEGQLRGIVHDENARALTGTGGSGHAGMFGTAPAVVAFGCAVLDSLHHRGGPFGDTDLSWLVATRPGGSLRAGFDGKSGEGSSAGSVCGPNTFGHLGFTGTSLWIDPDAEAVTVLLTNRVHPTRENQKIRTARPKVHDALFSIAARRRQA